MFKDLLVTIAAGVIGALPVTPAPAVVVTTANVEASVVQYIQKHEARTVSVYCNFNSSELSIKADEPQDFTCLTTDTENKEKFKTTISLSVVEEKVKVTANLDKLVKTDTAPTVDPSPATTEKK